MKKTRMHQHNTHRPDENKDYVLYWMQASQRYRHNDALNAAIKLANRLDLPVKVLFVLFGDFKDANARHFHFMLEGLKTLRTALEKNGIDFTVRTGAFTETVSPYLRRAGAFVMDASYLKPPREIKASLAEEATTKGVYAFTVESDLIVPLKEASQKEEHAARTLRPKITGVVERYLTLDATPVVEHHGVADASLLDDSNETIIESLGVDTTITKSPFYEGGEDKAHETLESFLQEGLPFYTESSDPSKHVTSTLSMYLHFGMISPVYVYNRVKKAKTEGNASNEAVDAFLEQLLVRRELAFNYVWHREGYDRFETMTDNWAYETMRAHQDDKRPVVYGKDDYIHFNTHDPYFNAAMKSMVKTGYMHNTMRMYWGKKIIEWSKTFEEAYETILSLNNAYFIDGRDPVSYASVAWLFGKHDHGWTERAVLGKLRYMNGKGLKRKYAIEAYVNQCEKL